MISISCQSFHRFIMDVCIEYTFTYLLAVGKHQSFDVHNMNRKRKKKQATIPNIARKHKGLDM